jgi:glycosyltransferase involved in cell wall biosynthesis
MHGRGAEFLDLGLSRIVSQSYPSIEVVVSDHSKNDAVRAVCRSWSDRLDIRYMRNRRKRGSSSANLNVAIVNCTGQLVKILCQDDYLADEWAIERTVKAFGEADAWLVSSYLYTADGVSFDRHDPRVTPDLAVANTIGTHSCLTIRNSHPELFDEDLLWLMDCEYYRRMHDRFGPPVILRDVTVVQMLWEGQVTNTYASDARLRQAERDAVRRRHPTPLAE